MDFIMSKFKLSLNDLERLQVIQLIDFEIHKLHEDMKNHTDCPDANMHLQEQVKTLNLLKDKFKYAKEEASNSD